MFEDDTSKERVKELAELAAELAELSRQHSEAMISAAYIPMNAAEIEEFDSRRLRIGELSELISKYKSK